MVKVAGCSELAILSRFFSLGGSKQSYLLLFHPLSAASGIITFVISPPYSADMRGHLPGLLTG